MHFDNSVKKSKLKYDLRIYIVRDAGNKDAMKWETTLEHVLYTPSFWPGNI